MHSKPLLDDFFQAVILELSKIILTCDMFLSAHFLSHFCSYPNFDQVNASKYYTILPVSGLGLIIVCRLGREKKITFLLRTLKFLILQERQG